MKKAILMLLGPTAAGKTALALALAERIPCRLISMDSAMVYRGLDIGTAKPSRAVRERFPHALIDIRDPAESYSAAAFVRDADREVAAAFRECKLPVLVGGAMLYARAFREGLAALPEASPEVRSAIAARAARDGWPKLHEQLTALDPEAAAIVHPNNPQRLQRALEVFEATGRPISAFWREGTAGAAQDRLKAPLIEVAVAPEDRALLHRRIARRLDAMLDAGFADEVRALNRRSDLHPGLPALRAVGYPQMRRHLEGEIDRQEMRDQTLAATRQLAKKQLTWLRNWPQVAWLPWAGPEAQAEQALARLR